MNKKKKGLTILDTTLWGGIIFGGFTLAIMLWDAYGPGKGTAEGIYSKVAPILNFAPEVARPHLGFDVKVMAWLHGSVFAATVDGGSAEAVPPEVAPGAVP